MRLLSISKGLTATASVLALTLALGSPAYAQQTDVPDSTTEADDPEELDQNEIELEAGQEAAPGTQEIVVTGSRIRRPNLESVVPVTSVGPQELVDRGDVSLGDALNELPALRSTFSQANSTRFIGTAGLNLLDLRGLGTTRTLVLVNGRRHVSATPGSYDVDVNTIPTDLIERVDLVTGGNSAIYGSDAVAGVVNFVLKRDFDGIKIRGQGGVSTYGDRGSYFISGVAGKNFFDNRVNAAVALEYAKQNALYHKDRNDLTGAYTGTPGFVNVENPFTPNVNNNGVPNTQFVDAYPGIKFNTYGLGGGVTTVCPLLTTAQYNALTPAQQAAYNARRAANCTGGVAPAGGLLSYTYFFQPDGTLVRNDQITDLRPVGGGVLGGLGITAIEEGQLAPGLERMSANLLLNADLSPLFQPFLEAKYVRVNSEQASTTGSFFNLPFSINNPYLTDQARATLQTILPFGATSFSALRVNNDIGTRREFHERDTYRIVVGAGGDLSATGNLRYEAAVNYGRTETYYDTGADGNIHIGRFVNSLFAERNAAGQIVCSINNNASTADDDPACVPVNLFGEGAVSREATAYFAHTSSREQWATQLNAIAFVSGDTTGLFELPGGPIGAALGVEYRKEDAYSAYDEVTSAGETFLNSATEFDPPAVEIKEAFGELRLPIFRNTPFFEELSLEGSARVSDYGGNTGAVWAYNAGIIWSPVRDVRLRASYARSVRAPNLGNLYATKSETFANAFVDPCNQGNPINANPNRAKNCAAAGIPTTMVVNGETRPWTNTSAGGISGFNQGNPDLEPEVGKSFTLGAVVQPSFIPGLSLSVDYYNIKIEQVIQGLTGGQVINRCYDDPVGIDNPFCAAIFRRTGTGDPLQDFTFEGQTSRTFVGADQINLPKIGPSFLNQPFNFAKLQTSGIDLDLAYRTRLGGDVVLNTRAIVSYVMDRQNFSYITDPDRSDRLHGTLGDPIWAASFNANLDFGMFDFGYNARFVGRQTIGIWELQHSHQGREPTNPDAFPVTHHPDIIYHNFRLGFEPTENFKFYTGVDNALNQMPTWGLDGTGGGGAIFPNTGRFFYAGAEIKF